MTRIEPAIAADGPDSTEHGDLDRPTGRRLDLRANCGGARSEPSGIGLRPDGLGGQKIVEKYRGTAKQRSTAKSHFSSTSLPESEFAIELARGTKFCTSVPRGLAGHL